jgi:superkiller protein 3
VVHFNNHRVHGVCLAYRRQRAPNWVLIIGFLILGTVGLAVAAELTPVRQLLPLSAAVPMRAAAPPTAEPTLVPSAPSAASHLTRGDSLLSQGRWVEAGSAYQQALQVEPRLTAATTRLARSLLYQNRMAEGLEQAQRAVDLEPLNPEAQMVLALAVNWNGNPDRAIIVGRRAVELDAKSAEALAYLAEAYVDKYRLREATEALDHAEVLDRGNPEVWRVRGYLLETQTDYQDAVAAYRKAIELGPGRSYLVLSLGHALRILKRDDEAIQVFTTAGELAPSDPRPHGGIGMVHYGREEYPAALVALERAVRIDPRYANGYAQMAWVYYVQRKYDQALPLFEQAVELERDKPRLAQYRHALGWIYLNLKQPAKARPQFEQALALNPELEGAKDGLAVIEGH